MEVLIAVVTRCNMDLQLVHGNLSYNSVTPMQRDIYTETYRDRVGMNTLKHTKWRMWGCVKLCTHAEPYTR